MIERSYIVHESTHKPDVVVFFTGPGYHDAIRKIFPGVAFESAKGFYPNELSYVIHSSLPTKTFITYHPKYLRLSKLEQKVLPFMVDDVNIIKE